MSWFEPHIEAAASRRASGRQATATRLKLGDTSWANPGAI